MEINRTARKPVAGADYAEGRKFTWHGFCSTTKSIKVLENPLFCGKTGRVATLFLSLSFPLPAGTRAGPWCIAACC